MSCRRFARGLTSFGFAIFGMLGVAAIHSPVFARPPHPRAAAGDEQPPDPGKELFTHDWQVKDPMAGSGDGIGPLFNAKSCAACHLQGGLGGSADVKHNAQMLSVVLPKDSQPSVRDAVLRSAASVHPGFESAATVPFHRFGTDNDYAGWRDNLVSEQSLMALKSHYRQERAAKRLAQARIDSTLADIVNPLLPTSTTTPASAADANDLPLQLTERNTPPLFGLGLIDKIPQTAILENAAKQHRDYPEIKGVFMGRFGWRGQINTLKGFVSQACANELGLQLKLVDQPSSPTRRSYRSNTFDMTERQVNDLTHFVANLPRPSSQPPEIISEIHGIHEGEKAFNAVGCAGCHTKTLDTVVGLYSDLLLHDMGSELSDPAPAASSPPRSSAGRGYFGSSHISISDLANVSHERMQQWRTPAAVGRVRFRGSYLHDGRATDLNEAILMHGGEAETCIANYKKLEPKAQQQLLQFLDTLHAPENDNPNALASSR